ncbi:MAG: DUF6783 domain-containing protein [Lachnospiraceae bacterium]|nr:DUF6783 domain-containing protein [Lachnospiraceae bacterium]
MFYPHSVAVARYAALIRIKSPTNWDSQLTKSLFQTRSSVSLKTYRMKKERQDYAKTIQIRNSFVYYCRDRRWQLDRGEECTENRKRRCCCNI